MVAKSASPASTQILSEIGLIDLPDDWTIVRIENLLCSDRGISVGVMYPGDHDPSGTPLIKAGDLASNSINPNPEFRITPDKHFEYRRTELAGGELLISLVGDVGRCALVPPSMAGWNAARAVAVLRFQSQTDAAFVRACLMSPPFQHLMRAWSTTTVQATLNLKEIRQIPLPWPPSNQRDAIAHILGTLDDKIELNRRRNQTLEAMARALFKDWFIDFGPVRAKMEGREPYLPADLWQLFPDRLDDEGKPEGWEVAELGDVTTELRRGVSPSYLESGGVRVLNQKCIRNREINLGPARRHDPSKRKIEGRVIMAGDILVNSTGVGTLGRTAQLWRIDEPTVVDSHVSVVRPNTDIVSICYLGLNLTGREAEIEMLGEGSTGQTELSRVRLGSLPVLVPPRQILEQFDADARPLLNAIFANTVESTALAQLRDTLLPKLISGELRIQDAEQFIEAAQ